MADDLRRWLEKLDLGKYAEILAEHEVSVRDLPHLTEDDLKDLGLPLGPRRRLLAAVKSSNEFVASTPDKVPVSVKVEKLNPVATVIYYGTIEFDHKGQEETFVRFTLDADGQVSDVNTKSKSLVRAVRRPGAGNAPVK